MKENAGGISMPETGAGPNNGLTFVGVSTRPDSLPGHARLPINRCSLPASILGSLSYQQHPVPLKLDGVEELHRGLFAALDALPDPGQRAQLFMAHMAAVFSLDHPEEAGHSAAAHDRARATYLRLLRGWAFDPDGQEGAVLKGWVESRFGLLPRHHGGPIRDFSGDTYRHYLEARSRGLYGANALEAQLDLLYTYCQYELARQRPGQTHLTLYRGVNRVADLEVLHELARGRRVVLLNSLNSFTPERERAGEFGDFILEVAVPLPKVFFFPRLLPGVLKGEDVKSRIRPVTHPFDQAVFQRIDVDIIHMRPEIRLVAYQVFPITALPNAAFATPKAYRGSMFAVRQGFGKAGLDQAPSGGKIRVAWRQFDHTVKVFRQHDPCVNNKGMLLPY